MRYLFCLILGVASVACADDPISVERAITFKVWSRRVLLIERSGLAFFRKANRRPNRDSWAKLLAALALAFFGSFLLGVGPDVGSFFATGDEFVHCGWQR